MSIVFHCDGCATTAPPGTVTGGFPGSWTVAYEYKGAVGAARVCTAILHYCLPCQEDGRAVRRERGTGAPETDEAEPVVDKPARRVRRKRATPKQAETDAAPDDQELLF